MFKGKSILITGGTGSLGHALVKNILHTHPEVKKIVIFSRDEQKQFKMAQEFPEKTYPQIRFFIGNVRDKDRLNRAINGIDYIIHAAAMKHVPISEYNPDECVKTNIGGAQNLIEVALQNNVKKVIALSTDKASSPINLYGATKLTSDKLFIAANNIKGDKDICFSVVRYGNVLGSNGSVIPFFINEKSKGVLPITDKSMTRFNITLNQGVDIVLFALENAIGGELFIPKIPSYKITDLAKAICPNCKVDIIGIRPGEKLHEEMISESDSANTYDIGKFYVIIPSNKSFNFESFKLKYKPTKVKQGFSYSSDKNTDWESVKSLKSKINSELNNV